MSFSETYGSLNPLLRLTWLSCKHQRISGLTWVMIDTAVILRYTDITLQTPSTTLSVIIGHLSQCLSLILFPTIVHFWPRPRQRFLRWPARHEPRNRVCLFDYCIISLHWLSLVCSFVTVSWNVFTEHFKTSLVGGSDNTGDEDSGHLRWVKLRKETTSVIWCHLPQGDLSVSLFFSSFRALISWDTVIIGSLTSILELLPSVLEQGACRWDPSGWCRIWLDTSHIYSNYFDNVLDSAIDSRDGAQTLVEDNVFDTVKNPIETTLNGGL